MRENEAAAHRLASDLHASGLACRVEGGGVHWKVELEPVNHRSVHVACFWYETADHALMLGMNPANRRSTLRKERPPREGAEFYVVLKTSGERVADGRTPDAAQVVTCARAWLSGKSLGELHGSTPFVDAQRRAMQSVGSLLDPRIRWEIGGDPGFELWAHENGRSCCVRGDTCSFLVGQVQVAFKEDLDGLPSMMASWLLERVGLPELRAQGALIERHAEVLLVDPARWHWLHVLDRIANPQDVLVGLAPLVRRLADSQIASRFYTFSSLNRLCFSASSHYPWVGTYPAVAPAGDGRYWVDQEQHSLEEAVALVEAALTASPFEPFFGSATDLALRLVTECLSRRGSSVRAEMIWRGQWSDVWLQSARGRCQVSLQSLTCFEERRWIAVSCATVDDVVAMALRFLEEGASFEELAADERVVHGPRMG
jgi:hypothetical protein